MSFVKRIFIGSFVFSGIFLTVSVLAQGVFKRNVKEEVEQLFDEVENNNEKVTEAEIEELPESIKRWFRYSGVVGKEKTVSVRLKQKAEMRLDKGGKWMPVEAEQYITTEEPGFIWNARIKAAPFVHIYGRDKYQNGKGNMLIRPLSLFTLADSSGGEIDQGTLLRYLAETMWFPSALLKDYIELEAIDQNNVKARMSFGEISSSGVFTIDDRGEVIGFQAKRYGEFGGEYRLETWSIPVSDYKDFDGIRIPTKGEITWELDEGDFNWFNFEVTDIEYDNPVPY